MLRRVTRDPAVLTSATAGLVLAAAAAAGVSHWWLWAAWAVLGCIALAQSTRPDAG